MIDEVKQNQSSIAGTPTASGNWMLKNWDQGEKNGKMRPVETQECGNGK
jgi:hypothetical protein